MDAAVLQQSPEIEQFKKRRIFCMLMVMISCIVIGFIYAWSVIQIPIVQEYGFAESRVAIAYTLINLSSNFASMIFGAVIRKLSIRQCVMIGSILYGGGMIMTSMMTGLWQLYLFFGIICGVGSGFIYPQMITYAVQLFPERSGFAAGLATASFGSGAVIWAPITSAIIASRGFKNGLFLIGLASLILIFCASLGMRQPPKAFLEMGEKMGLSENYVGKQYRRGEMIKQPKFYLFVPAFACGMVAGAIIISQASPILQNTLAFTPAKAAAFVSIFSALNMIGRFIWGGISDKIGLYPTITIVFILCILAMVLLAVSQSSVLLISVAMGLTTGCYGGLASVLTPMTASLFGKRYVRENFGIVIVVFGIASLVGPLLATTIKNNMNGSYRGAYIVAAVLGVVGFILFMRLRRRETKND